jgi:hypothetical protein
VWPKAFTSKIPTATFWNFICHVPPEEYRKTVSNPYYNYGSIEDELAGKAWYRRALTVLMN